MTLQRAAASAAAAMNVVAGGRGGVKVPPEAIPRVYDHLAKHCGQFGEEPPDL